MPEYRSQMLALPFAVVALVLFFVQLVAGGLLALYYLNPDLLSGIANFNLIRAYHINALILWLFSATFAAVFYLTPILAKRELWGQSLVKLLAVVLVLVVIGIFATLPLMQSGTNIWIANQPMLVEGKEYVEAGRLWDIFIFIGFIIVAVVVLKTLPSPKEWPLALWALVIGAAGTFILYIPGNLFFKSVVVSEYFRWWTVHYWVEGSLEVAYAGAIGLVLMLLIPDPRVKKVVDKYIFYDVILAATSGVIGQGHHYFWIGTPTFWILLGGVISVLEIVPLALMALESLRIAKELKQPFPNIPSLYFMVGILIFGFIGVSLLGLIQTWPWTNWWEHGTWVTPSHGHECMMAFAMGGIALLYLALPDLTGKPIDRTLVLWSKRAFWLMFIGQVILASTFGLAGTVQIYHYWILAEPWQKVLEARFPFVPGIVFGGAMVFLGYLHLAASMFRHLLMPVEGEEYKPAAVKKSFLTTFDHFPFLVVLAVFFALIGTTGLWSFSSSAVLEFGNLWIPFALSAIAYVGLGVLAVIMASKLARGIEYGHYIE
ncbi:Nitric-oxide reductase [Ferroglobus placidus DSM 10642]|uniref:Nitric-oxide reductase n=1 Tax=Ferroglobus placidus (strain DSM 10642 / AEDII12DO) TaxID=589924 RepID=D3RYC9_FERPA|nr:cbb3-type cytochrome c oxidase subunit I [Ferroglobus placidus]ADC65492.1 Nitric-oxide reductase [Ferroglobus placidus DSM 10642]